MTTNELAAELAWSKNRIALLERANIAASRDSWKWFRISVIWMLVAVASLVGHAVR